MHTDIRHTHTSKIVEIQRFQFISIGTLIKVENKWQLQRWTKSRRRMKKGLGYGRKIALRPRNINMHRNIFSKFENYAQMLQFIFTSFFFLSCLSILVCCFMHRTSFQLMYCYNDIFVHCWGCHCSRWHRRWRWRQQIDGRGSSIFAVLAIGVREWISTQRMAMTAPSATAGSSDSKQQHNILPKSKWMPLGASFKWEEHGAHKDFGRSPTDGDPCVFSIC